MGEQAPLAGLDLMDGPVDAPPRSKRLRPKPGLEQREEIVSKVLDGIRTARYERADWVQKRLARYAKLRGWLDGGNGVWDNSSNQHIPIIMANVLRIEAGMFNAVLGTRPVVYGKPLELSKAQIAERNDSLLDHQMFVDNPGERNLERYISQFVQDGTVFSYQPRVVERAHVHDVRVIPTPDLPLPDAMPDVLSELVKDNGVEFTALDREDDEGYEWCGYFLDQDKDERKVEIAIYDKEGPEGEGYGQPKLEVCFIWDAVVYDGPAMHVQDLEDIIAPMRSENLQPVTGLNPKGAPWSAVQFKVNMDQVRRRHKDGVYDLLTKAKLEEIDGFRHGRADEATDHNEDALKEAKDLQTGLTSWPAGGPADDRQWLTGYEWYGAYDLDGDGMDEEVILWILEEPKVLVRARYLTEQYPGLPPHRPFSEARFIPIAGQLYGMGAVELMEGISDFIHELINDNVDAGRLSSIPWFAYRANSQFKEHELRLEPGVGFPTDNPQMDLFFPQFGQKDQSWSFNVIGLAMQMCERLVQMSALQFGQVPQGKASALRSTGNMMAILQQSAALPEQILRRLFMGITEVYAQFHLLNTRFLPAKKRYLVTGKPLSQDAAYGMIDDRKDINIPITFDWRSTLLNTNKGAVAQSLQSIMMAMVNPLMIKFGITTPETMFNMAEDYVRASDGDASRYVRPPLGQSTEEKITAEEAILDITKHIAPRSMTFVEGTMQALNKLNMFMMSDDFGFLDPQALMLFKLYMQAVTIKAQQEMIQQQMLMQAASQFQAGMKEEGDGAGAPPQPGQDPGPQTQAPAANEVQGAQQAQQVGA